MPRALGHYLPDLLTRLLLLFVVVIVVLARRRRRRIRILRKRPLRPAQFPLLLVDKLNTRPRAAGGPERSHDRIRLFVLAPATAVTVADFFENSQSQVLHRAHTRRSVHRPEKGAGEEAPSRCTAPRRRRRARCSSTARRARASLRPAPRSPPRAAAGTSSAARVLLCVSGKIGSDGEGERGGRQSLRGGAVMVGFFPGGGEDMVFLLVFWGRGVDVCKYFLS